MARQKPRIISPCVAERYNSRKEERIIEFSGHAEERGGLISFNNRDEDIVVGLFRLDKDVKVNCPPAALIFTDEGWLELEAIIDKRRALRAAEADLAAMAALSNGG